MSTAIVRIYTPSGFVVGADGRSTNSATREITSDHVQKIYQFGNNPLALSFTGAAHLGPADTDDTSEVLFDFVAELTGAGQATSASRFRSLQEYAARVARGVNRKLEEVVRRGNIALPSIPSENPRDYGETILLAFLDGYHDARPDRVRIRFCHDGAALLPPDIITEPLTPMIPSVVGIPQVGEMIRKGEPQMRPYMLAVNLDDSYDTELALAVSFSRAFIQACGGHEACEIAPEIAGAIGGDTLIATMTPKYGFRWVPGLSPNDYK